jgi:hypothetical protein
MYCFVLNQYKCYARETAEYVPYDRQLLLKVDSFGNGKLTVHGEPFQPLNPLDVRAQNLEKYQEEMQVFTAFLRQIYFS